MPNKPRRAKISDRVRQLKEQLEARMEAEDNKIRHAENYSFKLTSMLGDICKKLVELEKENKLFKNEISIIKTKLQRKS